MILYSDLETFSSTPISSGTWAYAEAAEVLLWSWAVDESPAQCWDVYGGEPIPEALEHAIREADVVVGFNWGGFDDVILSVIGFPYRPPLAKVHDVMVQALAHSMPASLSALGEVLGVPHDLAKIKDGRRLINLFCKPRPKNMKLRRAGPDTHPEDWEKFKQYAINDVEAMRFCYHKLPRINYPDNPDEYRLWQLDQEINRRGVKIDLELVYGALEAADRCQSALADEMAGATGGTVRSATQRDALLTYLRSEFGVELPDLTSATVDRFLERDDLPEPVRELLQNRVEATRTSTAKYAKIASAVSSDGRLRGLLQFCGASRTGRWAGRTVQPQNFVRPPKRVSDAWEASVQEVKTGAVDLVDDNPMEVISGVLRGVFLGPVAVADLSNIEGRAVAWLAGEQWKIDAFREYDAGTGPDLYKLAYARSFGCQPGDVTKDQRQVGKVQELALGYGGGVGAFVTFANAYGVDLDNLARSAAIPGRVIETSSKLLDWLLEERGRSAMLGLSRETWVVCDALKSLWRAAHPNIVSLWDAIQNAAIQALRNRGEWFSAGGKLKLRADKDMLRIMLPSGRYLCYPGAQVDAAGQVTYWGINQYSRKWQRLRTYGGKLTENVTQAVARDILAHGIVTAEESGYRVVLSVHDEIVAEGGDHEGLIAAMTQLPEWAEGLPLAAAGFTAERYRKD